MKLSRLTFQSALEEEGVTSTEKRWEFSSEEEKIRSDENREKLVTDFFAEISDIVETRS